jgi:hypothetical protein
LNAEVEHITVMEKQDRRHEREGEKRDAGERPDPRQAGLERVWYVAAQVDRALAHEPTREAGDEGDADEDRDGEGTRREHQGAGRPPFGAHADQQRGEAEGDESKQNRVLERGDDIHRGSSAALGICGHCRLKPSRLPAGRECRSAGRSGR